MWCIFLLFGLLNQCAGISLEEALLKDIFPQSSSKCVGSGNTTFTHQFTWSNSSKWDKLNAKYEPQLFLAEMKHTDTNVNKSWRIRIAQGGNIYSLVGAFGESVPPQCHTNSPFNDEV